jgi:four helix bundle protein
MGTSYLGFKDLIVYKKSYFLSLSINSLSEKFPEKERKILTDQLIRSSRSIPANIAEAWGSRTYPKYFKSKLIIAYSEMNETKVWLDQSKDLGYINQLEYEEYYSKYDEIGAMLNSMINNLNKFCITK